MHSIEEKEIKLQCEDLCRLPNYLHPLYLYDVKNYSHMYSTVCDDESCMNTCSQKMCSCIKASITHPAGFQRD